MPRWLAHLLVVVGWLLTPVWAWAASYIGLWAGALVATGFARPLTMLAVAGGVAALWCGGAALSGGGAAERGGTAGRGGAADRGAPCTDDRWSSGGR